MVGCASPLHRALRIASRSLRVWLRTPGCARAKKGGRDERGEEDMPGNMTDGFHLVVEALKLNGVDTIYGVAGIPITDLLAVGAGRRHPLPRLSARAVGRERGRDRRVSDAEAGHLHDGLGPRLSERDGRLGQRHDQLFPDDPDQRVERPGDRRSRAGRLRGDGPAERRAALCQGGLPRQPAARHRHRHRAGDPRRLLGAPGRRLSRPDGRGARLGARRRRRRRSRWSRSSIRRRRSPRRRKRSRAPSNCWRMPSARW